MSEEFIEDIIRKIFREELDKIIKELLQPYIDKSEQDDLFYSTVKNIVEKLLGDSNHLRILKIEFLTKQVLKEILQPKMKDLTIKLDIEPKPKIKKEEFSGN